MIAWNLILYREWHSNHESICSIRYNYYYNDYHQSHPVLPPGVVRRTHITSKPHHDE
jgi:hypothetical protein